MTTPALPTATPAPDAVAPPPHHPRFPALDGMRAISALAIVVVHAGVFGIVGDSLLGKLVLHLNVGVTIFFLISGFLLYRPFVAHRTGGAAAPAMGDYAKRRLLRILPAYWLILLVLVLVPGLTGVPGNGAIQEIALVHTLPLGDGPACVSAFADCGLAQTWSLVVEFTFYALLPLYVVIAARLARGRSTAGWLRVELTLLAALSAASVLLHYVVVDSVDLGLVVGGTLLGYWLWFALGLALALLSVAVANRSAQPVVGAIAAHPWVPWAAAAVVYVAIALALPPTPFLADNADRILAHVGFALVALLLMLPAVFGGEAGGAPRRLLLTPVVAWLGLVSYGIFLWHYAIILELGEPGRGWPFLPLLATTIAVTVPIAAISYYFVERPLLRLKYRSARDFLTRRHKKELESQAAFGRGEGDRS